MLTPLKRVVRALDRTEIDEAICEALRRVRLALGEVRVVERRKDHVVTHRTVVNKEAIGRARKAYTTASMLVGKARQADGTTSGPQRRDRRSIENACDTLNEYQRQLADLEGIE